LHHGCVLRNSRNCSQSTNVPSASVIFCPDMWGERFYKFSGLRQGIVAI
jgi:hypothetical protein